MTLKNIGSYLKRNSLNFLVSGLLLIVIFSPAAKSWLLKQLISTGLFNAEIKKDKADGKLSNYAAFSFTDPAGKTTNTTALNGKIVFINFWASWCPPCRAEMPSINELYKKLKDDKRFVFLFIDEDDDKIKAKEYMESNHLVLPVYYRDGNVPDKIFAGSLPTTIILDKEGKIVFRHEGIGGYDTGNFLQQLRALL